MANHPENAHKNHSNLSGTNADEHEEKRIAKEMFPFLIYAAIPILLIAIIALKYGPSY